VAVVFEIGRLNAARSPLPAVEEEDEHLAPVFARCDGFAFCFTRPQGVVMGSSVGTPSLPFGSAVWDTGGWARHEAAKEDCQRYGFTPANDLATSGAGRAIGMAVWQVWLRYRTGSLSTVLSSLKGVGYG